MSEFIWVGGNLSSAASYTEVPPQTPEVGPGVTDNVTFNSSGLLAGGLSVAAVDMSGGPYTLTGGITASNIVAMTGALTLQGGGVNTPLFGVGALAGAGSVVQTTGNVTVGNLEVNDGTYELDAGNVNVTSTAEFIGDEEGATGSFTQKGGINSSVTNLEVGTLGDGSYTLSGGTLFAPYQFIGQNATGSVVQSSGTDNAFNRIVLGINLINGAAGSGSYTLGGSGVLDLGTLFDGSDPGCTGVFAFDTGNGDNATLAGGGGNAPLLFVGGQGTGTFTQGGGSISAGVTIGRSAGGDGTYDLNAGTLSIVTPGAISSGLVAGIANAQAGAAGTLVVGAGGKGKLVQAGGLVLASVDLGKSVGGLGEYDINGGVLIAAAELVGDSGTGSIVQTAGQNMVTASAGMILGNATSGVGTYDLSGGSVTVQTGSLVVGNLGTGYVKLTGGMADANLDIAAQAGSDGSVDVQGGTITGTELTVGDGGTGTLEQTAGDVSIDGTGVFVGNAAGGVGTYDLGGLAVLAIAAGDLDVGVGGNAQGEFDFNTGNGDAALLTLGSGIIEVGVHGSGTFTDGGGVLNNKVVVGGQVGGHGTFVLAAGATLTSVSQVVGNDGVGLFTEGGGSNAINGGGDLLLGAFHDGAGAYALSGGLLTASGEVIGNDGLGSFMQTGGVNAVPGIAAANLALGLQADGTGSYDLAAGSLVVGSSTVAGQELVGGAGKGVFLQTGGTHQVFGALLIGDSASATGSYTLSGGTVQVQSATSATAVGVTLGAAGGSGTLSIGNALLTTPTLVIGAASGGAGAVTVTAGGVVAVGNGLELAGNAVLALGTAGTGNVGAVDIGSGLTPVAGVVQVGAGGTLHGAGTIQGAVSLTAGGGVTAGGGGLLDLAGSVAGAGTLTIAAGVTLELGGTATPSVAFAGGSGLLLLDAVSDLATPIASFTAGDEIGVKGTAVASTSLDGSGHTLSLFGAGAAPLGSIVFAQAVTAGEVAALANGDVGAPCFAQGTRIATEGCDIPVEALRIGDRVRTAGGALRPVVWLGHRTVALRRHPRPWDVLPVRVRAGAFGAGVPVRDLLLSPDHAVFADGVLIPIRYLLNGATVVQEAAAAITYWHVELDAHDVLLAEGLACESYLDTGNRGAFAEAPGAIHLHPDFARRVWQAWGRAPLVREGAALAAIRSRLLGRAEALGFRQRREAGLRLMVDGRCLRAAAVEGTRHRFVVQSRAGAVRIRSRGGVPAEMGVACADARRLGVMLTGARVFLPWRWQEIALFRLPAADGLYAPERAGGRRWRWTDGDAWLPLPAAAAREGALMLELEVAAAQASWHRMPRRADAA